MRPRDNKERMVAKLSNELGDLSFKQIGWFIQHAFDGSATVHGKTKYCLKCGAKIVNGKHGNECPSCGKISHEWHSLYDGRVVVYGSVFTTYKGYQVLRHVNIVSYRGRSIDAFECVQEWIDNDGRIITIARSRHMNPFYCDLWNENTDMTIKRCNTPYAKERYMIWSDVVYPYKRFIDKLKRNGYDGTNPYYPSCVISCVLNDNFAEYLYKIGQHNLLAMYLRGSLKVNEAIKSAIKICTRNRYVITDAQKWVSLIGFLEKLGKDVHNHRFVCPADFVLMYEEMKNKYERVIHKEEETRERASILNDENKDNESYINDMKKYFGLVITGNGLKIRPLMSVMDFYEEGLYMKHCVYNNRYYANHDSLIMSAMDEDGKRVETIEYDLKNNKIVQSRGRCNQKTEMHDEIIQLVESNKNLIAML